MLFSSLEFIFLFLPLSVGIYFALPQRLRNAWLLISGLCFYGFGEPKFLPLMLLTILADFLFGVWIGSLGGNKKRARAVLILAVVYNIGQLAFFKYFDFLGIGLPIGISFYTFQALSYVIDVYRREVAATKSIVAFGAYVSLFPQLIAGPIVRYTDIERELYEREHRLSDIASGMRTFCAGLAKKVLLANVAGQMWESLAPSGYFADTCLGIFFFSMQIYFDFSGYSDMAIGLGRVFGFNFPKNFDYPYISGSITDFWRRWHITLSSWFREYVYIPLGGNRGGQLKTYRNLLITWALTGIWHGATLNFLLWGLYFALILILEKAFLKRILDRAPKILSHLYALTFIAIGWVIFAFDGSIEGFNPFLWGANGLASGIFSYELLRNLPFMAIMTVGATPLPRKLYLKMRERTALLDIILPLLAFVLSIAYIVSSGYDPFLYFRF